MSDSRLGKLISTEDGRVSGPRYGEVYTASEGQKGFFAGYRSKASAGAGLMGLKWFDTKKEAQDYAVKMSSN